MFQERSATVPAPGSGSLAEAYAYCRDMTQRSSSNFYHAFRLLTRERHNALCALYAFCRFVDDIADQNPAPVDGKLPQNRKERLAQLLDMWREELVCCYEGIPRHPISRALADAVRRFPIRQEHLAGIIDGVAMDLGRTRYQTFSELYEYCYRVASLVGLVCIEIFGYQSPRARDYATHLGIAFQLTNILRDVGEDADRGRIYLPLADLDRFAYSEQELLSHEYNMAFLELMTFESQRAQEYYSRAVSLLNRHDRRSLVAAEAMRLIYHELLKRIARQQFKVFQRRVTLPTPFKVGLAFTAWGRSVCVLP